MMRREQIRPNGHRVSNGFCRSLDFDTEPPCQLYSNDGSVASAFARPKVTETQSAKDLLPPGKIELVSVARHRSPTTWSDSGVRGQGVSRNAEWRWKIENSRRLDDLESHAKTRSREG